MTRIINREASIDALTKLASSGGPRLALLYGRRRVGKTYLLTNLWPRSDAFYFTASATSPDINRQVLIAEAAQWSGLDLRPADHPTWRTVFRSILQLAPDRHLVVVLDEFQYLARDEEGLLEVASELNAVWEGDLHRSGGVLAVLSGSAIRTLEALKKGGSPLYGRLDWADRILPFDYLDAGHMVEAYSHMDRIRTYAAFGGVPKYLAAVDQEVPVARNIIDLLLSPSGQVRLQLETVLGQEEGLREYMTYHGILATVGIARRELGEIAAAMGVALTSPLRTMVNRLVELEFLEAAQDFDAPRNRALRYRIADPALRMYYGLVLPNESAIASAGAERVWRERLEEQAYPTYVGQHVFEDVVQQAYRRHANARGLPGVAEWGRWAGRDRERQDMEFDVVARTLDGRIMTGSAKMRRGAADAGMLLEHIGNLRRLADSGRAWAHEALQPDAPLLFVSAAGFRDSFMNVANGLEQPVITWTVDDLF
jgi:AAA+ ATPase superfamily predicted ATPase